MGHERVGFLPKTKKWKDLINQMGSVSSSEASVAAVATRTLYNVRQRYEKLSRDNAVKSAFSFLVAFSRACRSQEPSRQLQYSGIAIPGKPNLLSIVKALHETIPPHESASEYGQLALAAASDALGQWQREHAALQISLFQTSDDFFERWRDVGNGAGFCELARLYFGKLTERYLSYFLDREASATFPSISQRDLFQSQVRSHIDEISKHAFETAQITQSFAAGWFNAHARDKLPDNKEVEGFLAIAFGKLRDELRREGESK